MQKSFIYLMPFSVIQFNHANKQKWLFCVCACVRVCVCVRVTVLHHILQTIQSSMAAHLKGWF